MGNTSLLSKHKAVRHRLRCRNEAPACSTNPVRFQYTSRPVKCKELFPPGGNFGGLYKPDDAVLCGFSGRKDKIVPPAPHGQRRALAGKIRPSTDV